MSGRLFFCLILAATISWLPSGASAQGLPWNAGQQHTSFEPPASVQYGTGQAVPGTSYPRWGNPPYGGKALWPNDYVDGVPEGYQVGYGYPDASLDGYGPEYNPRSMVPPATYGVPQTIYQLIPQNRGILYDEDIARIKMVRNQLSGSWARIEYLNYSMKNPGDTLLGAPIAGVANPREDFVVQVLDGTGNLTTVGTARVMDMSPVDLQHMQGARVRFGIATGNAEYLGSFWGIESVSRFSAGELNRYTDRIIENWYANPLVVPPPDINPNAHFIATSLLDNGVASSLLVLYDRDFQVKYNVKTWGAEANIAYLVRRPGIYGWKLQTLLGFRHESHLEELIQRGSFDNRSGIDLNSFLPVELGGLGLGPIVPPINNEIYSETRNRRYALQVGLRSQWISEHLIVGVEPKIAFGVNRYKARVRTRDLRDSTIPPIQDDGIVETELQDTVFAPTFDLGINARLKVTKSFSITAGYNFIYMWNNARADDVIYYNDAGLAVPPAIVVRPDEQAMWVQGFTVGGEITWP